jgi:cytochrome c oxidase assembly protein subunit 16
MGTNDTGIPVKKKKKPFSMAPIAMEDLDTEVRGPRPAGAPEWGYVPGATDAPLKGHRKEDRWV